MASQPGQGPIFTMLSCVKIRSWPIVPRMKNNGIALKDNGQSTRSRANLYNAPLCEDWLLIYCAKNEEQWYSSEGQWSVNQVKGQSKQCSAVWRLALDLLCQEWRTMVRYSTEKQWSVNQVKGQSSQRSVVWRLALDLLCQEWRTMVRYSTEGQWSVNQIKGQSSQRSAVWRLALDLLCQEWRTMV